MIIVITAAAATSAVRLVVGILQKADFPAPGNCSRSAVVGWTTNVIAFALWYWHLDGGGPAARASGNVTTAPSIPLP